VLELGKAGTTKGVLPVLRDGAVVATLRASNWKESATPVVGELEWLFARHRGELTARWAAEPAGAARLRARQKSFWKDTWAIDLEGRQLESQNLSMSSGSPLAESGTTGGWSPRPTLSADPALPLHQQVFLLWLELVISRRNTAAVSAGAGAAVIRGSS
jgi:hypothetical protein